MRFWWFFGLLYILQHLYVVNFEYKIKTVVSNTTSLPLLFKTICSDIRNKETKIWKMLIMKCKRAILHTWILLIVIVQKHRFNVVACFALNNMKYRISNLNDYGISPKILVLWLYRFLLNNIYLCYCNYVLQILIMHENSL